MRIDVQPCHGTPEGKPQIIASTVPSARMSQQRALLLEPYHHVRASLEHKLAQLSHAARTDDQSSAESKNTVQAAPPAHAWAFDKQHTAV